VIKGLCRLQQLKKGFRAIICEYFGGEFKIHTANHKADLKSETIY
jgi:hypothetical protein